MTVAHQVRSYTLDAAGFTDSVDVLYVAQMMEKFMEYVTQLREVSDSYKVWLNNLHIHFPSVSLDNAKQLECVLLISEHPLGCVASCRQFWWRWAVI